MPAPIFRRQPGPPAAHAAAAWFDGEAGRELLAAEAGLLAPLLERNGGDAALHLSPCASAPPLSAGTKTRQLTRLFRDRERWSGDLHSAAGNLPLRGGSMDAIVAWHVLADAEERELLAAELLRVLAPEGVLLLVELDPWSLYRTAWAGCGPAAWSAPAAAQHLGRLGFGLLARHGVGARWSHGRAQAARRLFAGVPLLAQASFALSFRKREAAGAAVGLAMA